jgi:hypothetical protein
VLQLSLAFRSDLFIGSSRVISVTQSRREFYA